MGMEPIEVDRFGSERPVTPDTISTDYIPAWKTYRINIENKEPELYALNSDFQYRIGKLHYLPLSTVFTDKEVDDPRSTWGFHSHKSFETCLQYLLTSINIQPGQSRLPAQGVALGPCLLGGRVLEGTLGFKSTQILSLPIEHCIAPTQQLQDIHIQSYSAPLAGRYKIEVQRGSWTEFQERALSWT